MPEDDRDSSRKDSVIAQLQLAERALSDAEGARDAALSDAVVINRCYYACFHAAQAVLYERGTTPGSHGGVLSRFGSEVVVEGDAPRAHGRLLNRLSELRKQADYGYGSIDEDLDELLSAAKEFVEHAGSLCGGR